MKCCDAFHRRTFSAVREVNKAEATEKETPHLNPKGVEREKQVPGSGTVASGPQAGM